MNGSPAALEQLDQLGSRLERFASSPPQPTEQTVAAPTPRKTSPGTMIPRPEVSPKPAFLSSLAVNAKMSRMAQSMKSPSKAKSPTAAANGNGNDAKTAASNAATKVPIQLSKKPLEKALEKALEKTTLDFLYWEKTQKWVV